MNKKQKRMLRRILISGAIFLVTVLLPVPEPWRLGLSLAAYLVIGWDILKKAGKGILNGRVFDENFLMAIASLGALLLAVITDSGDYMEAIAVMLFYQVGELFQSYAVGKSRKNITALMDIRPDYANVEQDGVLTRVDPEEVAPGSLITVQPGEKVPLDGIVIRGNSSLNTSALTGESVPRDVVPGDTVVSGCVNLSGVLEIRTTKEFGESTVSKILELVENASSHKSRSEAYISRFAKWYTPTVCAAAAVLALLPPLLGMAMGQGGAWGVWLYRALTFLVVSCPCALVISIPLSFFAGIGGASKAGILVKGSNYLEALAKTGYVVFDKTGTLTQGSFQVTGIHHSAMEEKALLEYAALAESASSHPISKSLRQAWGGEADRSRVADVEEISGCGIQARVDGRRVAVGNARLMERLKVAYAPCRSQGTIVHVAIDGSYAGHIVISDVPKANAARAVEALKAAGVRKTIMLTGDIRSVAEAVAGELGIDEVHSDLLPGDKVAQLEEILAGKKPREMVAFVGDGINDAPVLTRADIGIAMGAMGSDAAIEAADVVLMDDDPMQLARAIRISRKCLGIVRQNIVFALGVKFACLALTAVGIGNMWLAIFADVGVMVLAVLNAIRALDTRRL